MKLYLCSKSPRRVQLLNDHKIDFEIIDNKLLVEPADDILNPFDHVAKLSFMKVSASKNGYDGIIVGADTGIVFNNRLIGKPSDLKNAIDILSELNGKSHLVVSACCLLNTFNDTVEFCIDYAKVSFKLVSKNDIEEYVKIFRPLDKAGAYGIQDSPKFLNNLEGNLDTVLGLPMNKLLKLFRDYGIVKSC